MSFAELTKSMGPLGEIIAMGGPVVTILLLLSIVALALVIAKLWHFRCLHVGRHRDVRGAVAFWSSGQKEKAILSIQRSNGALARCLSAAMKNHQIGQLNETAQREEAESQCSAQLANMRAYLRPLDMIAQIAPLLGLFGTVIGMIEAFQAMADAGAQVDPAALAGGIWVALLTTAVGLAVAIPASVMTSYFDGRVENEQQEMEVLLTAVFTRAGSRAQEPQRAANAAMAHSQEVTAPHAISAA
ncbi:MotA/TolQ/ExbB proton channel family protein [Polycladidibacter hongkongensis]|uniref:MotA/TolQ/ExbB proton channel family protein n=1 Tax=Polycladidibacter hongkongensis TaxID=1647556 RepID=UPI0009E99A27|nr:MotA/TolQ/ExbB proton channel family protein [Pseudovibrio hongkongensis]